MDNQSKNTRLSHWDIIIMCLIGTLAITGLGVFASLSPIKVLITIFGFSCLMLVYGFIPQKPEPVTGPDLDYETVMMQQARLADGISDPVMIINQNERIMYANPAARDLFSLQDVGGEVSSLVKDKAIRSLIAKTLAGDEPDSVIVHTDIPVERHIRVTGSLIETDAVPGVTKQAVFVFYEITDLIRVNTMRADFLANASHELKTPIASLLGYIETLRGHAKDDPKAQDMFLEIMHQQAERMQRLIDDLLSLRRIEIVEHLVPTETGDLFLASRAAIEAVEPMAQKRNVKITYEGPDEVLVTGVQDELVQLVLNLLDNAVVFTPEKEIVRLSIKVQENFQPENLYSEATEFSDSYKRVIVPLRDGVKTVAILKIRDSGPGFPKEHLPRLAERFYKVSEPQAGQRRGTGLGLAIVKHIMRRHRGGLFLETQPDVGTEFSLVLPLRDLGR